MSYTDLTEAWEHKTLLTYQLLQSIADNDLIMKLSCGLDCYLDFESAGTMIDYGCHPNWTGDSYMPTSIDFKSQYRRKTDWSDYSYSSSYTGSETFDPNLFSTTIYKFGNGAYYSPDNSNNTIHYYESNNDDWDISSTTSGAYTIHLWVKFKAVIVGIQTILCHLDDADNTDYWVFEHDDGAGLRYKVFEGGSLVVSLEGGEITDTDWHHVALVRVGDEYGIYLDGVQTAYVQDASTKTIGADSGHLAVGGDFVNYDYYFAGYMDEIEFTATNKFSAAPNDTPDDEITVPTAASVTDANTKFLVHFDKAAKYGDYGVTFIEYQALLCSQKMRGNKYEGTVSFWVANIPLKDYNQVFFSTMWGLNVYITADNGYLGARIYDATGNSDLKAEGTTNISSSPYVHIAVAWRCHGTAGDYITVYLNGAEEATTQDDTHPIAGGDTVSNFMFGGSVDNGNGFWTGEDHCSQLPSAGTLFDFEGLMGGANESTDCTMFADPQYGSDIALKINTLPPDGTGSTAIAYYAKYDADIDFDSGFTLDWSLKVDTSIFDMSASDDRLSVFVRDGTQSESINVRFCNFGIVIISNDTKQWYMSTTDDFHTYRIRVSGTTWKFYADSVMVLTGTVKGSDAGNDEISFGDRDSTDGYNSSSYWDKVSYMIDWSVQTAQSFNIGCIDDFAMWGRALDESELLTISNAGVSIGELLGLGSKEIQTINTQPARCIMVTGVTANPTTTSQTSTPMTDMNFYWIKGSYPLFYHFTDSQSLNDSGATFGAKTTLTINSHEGLQVFNSGVNSRYFSIKLNDFQCPPPGAVYATINWYTDSAVAKTLTSYGIGRTLIGIEER